jgi:hypothetical protein
MRRRRRGMVVSVMGSALTPVRPSAPLSPTSYQIRNALDVPDRLRALIDDIRREREESELRLALNVAQDPPTSLTFRSHALEFHRAWEVEDNRLGEELDALTDLHKVFKRQVDSLKSLYPEQVEIVLKERLDLLVANLSAANDDVMALTKQIQKLNTEIKSLKSSDTTETPSPKK